MKEDENNDNSFFKTKYVTVENLKKAEEYGV